MLNYCMPKWTNWWRKESIFQNQFLKTFKEIAKDNFQETETTTLTIAVSILQLLTFFFFFSSVKPAEKQSWFKWKLGRLAMCSDGRKMVKVWLLNQTQSWHMFHRAKEKGTLTFQVIFFYQTEMACIHQLSHFNLKLHTLWAPNQL